MLQKFAVVYSTNTHLSGSALIPIIVISGVVGVIEVAGMWRVFKKAGRPGWAAIIPIYDFWVLFEIAGKPGWWSLSFLLGFIPVVGWIIPVILEIIALIEIAKRFSKSAVFAIFGLLLFGFVGWPMLGFGDAKYQAPATTPQAPTAPTTPAEPPSNPVQ